LEVFLKGDQPIHVIVEPLKETLKKSIADPIYIENVVAGLKHNDELVACEAALGWVLFDELAEA